MELRLFFWHFRNLDNSNCFLPSPIDIGMEASNMEVSLSLDSGMSVTLRHAPYPNISLIFTYPRNLPGGYWACRAMTKVLQDRAAAFRGTDTSSLFPENRTYQDGGGKFRWEFSDVTQHDLEGLWKALDTDNEGGGSFLRLFRENLSQY